MAARKKKVTAKLTKAQRAEVTALRDAGYFPYLDSSGNLAAVKRKVGGTKGRRTCRRGRCGSC